MQKLSHSFQLSYSTVSHSGFASTLFPSTISLYYQLNLCMILNLFYYMNKLKNSDDSLDRSNAARKSISFIKLSGLYWIRTPWPQFITSYYSNNDTLILKKIPVYKCCDAFRLKLCIFIHTKSTNINKASSNQSHAHLES